MGRKYQSIVETVGNTPVVRINHLAPKGVNLFVKIEAFNPLGSVKDRLALGVIEAAEKSTARLIFSDVNNHTADLFQMLGLTKHVSLVSSEDEALSLASEAQP